MECRQLVDDALALDCRTLGIGLRVDARPVVGAVDLAPTQFLADGIQQIVGAGCRLLICEHRSDIGDIPGLDGDLARRIEIHARLVVDEAGALLDRAHRPQVAFDILDAAPGPQELDERDGLGLGIKDALGRLGIRKFRLVRDGGWLC